MDNTVTPIVYPHSVHPKTPPKGSAIQEDMSLLRLVWRHVLKHPKRGGQLIEACSTNSSPGEGFLSGRNNAFVSCIGDAYSHHWPLVLSPEDVWLCIVQGVAIHIGIHAESLRHKFVEHAGTLELNVDRHDFVQGSEYNDWQGVFSEFGQKIKGYVGAKYDLLVPTFTTTTPVSQAATEIALLDAMKSYFTYTVTTLCGFPSITLLGTKQDWESIVERVRVLAEFKLDWWAAELLPVLENICATFDGTEPKDFWRNLYREHSSSGGDYVDGWLVTLFPYIGRPGNWRERKGTSTVNTSNFPSGFASAPFVWNYYGELMKYQFISGFIGTRTSKEGARPAIGWVVSKEVRR